MFSKIAQGLSDEKAGVLVNMGEMSVIFCEEEDLGTEEVLMSSRGLGPCIGIFASGVAVIEKESAYFLALYHWSGQEKGEDPAQIGNNCLEYFYGELCEQLGDDVHFILESCALIGGQKASSQCSGTEKEISAVRAFLRNPLKIASIFKGKLISENFKFSECVFSTEGDEVLDVFLSLDADGQMQVQYQQYSDSGDDELSDSQNSGSSPYYSFGH